MTDLVPEPDPKIVREIAGEHVRSGRTDVGITVELMLIGRILGCEELAVWERAVVEAIRSSVLSWPDEQSAVEPDLSGWSMEENAEFEEMYGAQAAMGLRAANDRVWAIVQELRSEAVRAGRDPYQDPMAQRLSAALVGAEGHDCLCPHTYQPNGRLVRDGMLALGCPAHDPDAGRGDA